jgi:hypothetical protein
MRHLTKLSVALALLAAVAAAGCGQNTETTSETMADSLLSSAPIDQPEGDITPQEAYQEPQISEPEPTPAPRPRARPASSTPRPAARPADTGVTLAAGTPIDVAVNIQISSATAKAGDTWTGEVKENVISGDRVVIPAGSTISGTVVSALAAEKGERASLDLAVTSFTANGKTHAVSAGTEAIVAGSTRARNLGAIAGTAAAGAIVGKAVGGSKGALIGGLLGGAAATGAVAKSKGYQVVLKEGTVLTFNVADDTKVRL